MTHNEILNLEAGQEIDELVAIQVMKWHIETTEYGHKHWNDGKGYICGVATYDGYEDGEDFHILHWNPSQSIKWASDEVLEKIKDKIFGIFWRDIPSVDGWTVCLSPYSSDSGALPVFGETLPLAICRAALLTITWGTE
jgi:hypothetical protein